MALDDIIRNGVATANRLTASLQPVVSHSAWLRGDGVGGSVYAAPISRQALVERKHKIMRDAQGQEIAVSHLISFLYPIAANGAAGRTEPVDPRDKIVLADGTTGDVVAVEGFDDPDTDKSYFLQVWLGTRK